MKRVARVLFFVLVSACGASRKNGPAIGESTANDLRGPTAIASAAPAHRSNAIPADYKTTMQRVGSGRFFSRGHAAGRFDAELYAADPARAAFASANGEFQVGSRFVEAHFEKATSAMPTPPSPDEAPGPLFMMEKMPKGFDADHGDWKFVALSSTGELVAQGKIESCVGCHDDATHDHVFPTE
jgi:Cytochrome P460